MKHQKTGLYILIVYCIMQLSGAIFAPLLLKLFVSMDVENPRLVASGWWVFLSFGIATLITLLLIRRDNSFLRPMKGKMSPIWQTIGWGFLGFLLVFFGQGIAAYIELALGIEPGSENTAQFIEIAHSVPLAIFSIVIFAPILEELIFRRIIFGSLLPKTNFVVAAAVSAIVFAIIHFDFTHILLYAVSGFIFAFIYYKTKRILASIISHMLLNGFVVLFQFYGEAIQEFLKTYSQMP
ncbi:CPBP family intramembrane glutamic endopeptidase [Psychrobacillus vulpis]|uniref:CPBP family intramembrane metalloprotease n=1 Tax=Psychrobacillus vulpis TaxID=2325572 RepID=A0A544TVC7_9BACI|nr:type II CAAX endopeptidase family protein [Psychrobacillus vulpis]TQR21408.1 CPBP family intramembrane metalloprotease [Psychrobacillus vulpis]